MEYALSQSSPWIPLCAYINNKIYISNLPSLTVHCKKKQVGIGSVQPGRKLSGSRNVCFCAIAFHIWLWWAFFTANIIYMKMLIINLAPPPPFLYPFPTVFSNIMKSTKEHTVYLGLLDISTLWRPTVLRSEHFWKLKISGTFFSISLHEAKASPWLCLSYPIINIKCSTLKNYIINTYFL